MQVRSDFNHSQYTTNIIYCPPLAFVSIKDVEAAISSTASTPIASASNRAWALSEPGLYVIYEIAGKHDYQNQQLTIYKDTLLAKMITSISISQQARH